MKGKRTGTASVQVPTKQLLIKCAESGSFNINELHLRVVRDNGCPQRARILWPRSPTEVGRAKVQAGGVAASFVTGSFIRSHFYSFVFWVLLRITGPY